MRNIISFVFKYLAWALLIIAVMLYMQIAQEADLRQVTRTSVLILAGVVIVDIIFSVAGAIRRSADRNRKNKEKKLKEKARTAKEKEKETKKEAKAAIKEAQKNAAAEATAPDPSERAKPVLDAAENTWETIKEKSTAIGTAIKDRLSGGGEAE